MKEWKKTLQYGVFVILCILLNVGGRLFANRFSLPFWLDAFGTILCAYFAGPICGAIVGATGNCIIAMIKHVPYMYALVSIALAIIVGCLSKRHMMDSLLGSLTIGAVSAIVCTLISFPLNLFFNGGAIGNFWGDNVALFFSELGLPKTASLAVGEFYIDFGDKFLCVLILFGLLRIYHHWQDQHERKLHMIHLKSSSAALLLCLLLNMVGFSFLQNGKAEAAQSIQDYTSYVQTIYNSKNGLPCGEANDIVQTNDGILWIGTYAGLYRYNGQEFRWMDGYDSVHNVNCMYVDGEGRLWIGTNDNGLSIAINEKITNVLDQSKGLPSNSVRSIVESTDGYFYIGTTGSMQVMTLSRGLKVINTLWEINYADVVAADENGHVAAVTEDGRLFLLYQGQILSSLQLTDRTDIFRAACFTADGLLLGGTSSGRIYTYDISGDSFEELGSRTCTGLTSIKSLNLLSNGELFITADNGIAYIDTAGSYHNINTNDFNNAIDSMLVDYQGNLWFTSSRLGLLRMAPSDFLDLYGTVGIGNEVVNTIVRWQNAYYIGTDSGLTVIDSDLRHSIDNDLTKDLEGIRIRCMLVDSDDHLWICTYGQGLIEAEADGTTHVYNNQNGSFGNRARLVTQLRDGTILAGGNTGITFIRDYAVLQTIKYSDGLINSMILTATELQDGTILAGTDGDGIAVIEAGHVSKMLTRKDGLSSEVILRTVADPATNGVFIVTSNGLCYMDDDQQIRQLSNFPYFNNYDIFVHNNSTLYVLSSAGIYVVDREELLSGKENLGYTLLNARQGLNSSLTANAWLYLDEGRNLFLPCDTGVFIINVENDASRYHSYRMSVTSLRVDGETTPLERSSNISVARTAARIELFPEIINYTIQDPYAGYFLEGFDQDWTIVPQSTLGTIVYTNLPPGDYTFHLAVFDNNQEEILSERSYSLIKEQSFSDEPLFLVYIIAVPMLLVAWLSWFIAKTQSNHRLEIANKQIEMGNQTIIAIAKAVDAKDERTSLHSQRVSQYSVLIAEALGFDHDELEKLRRAALMHDIGKIGIPDNILNKPARLTDDEYAVMKSHTVHGGEILKDFTLIDHVVEGALYHHERYDGRGYPHGLKGEEIPLYARIIGVADAFDAMTANRVYRNQMDFDYVLGEMHKGRGTQFDPQMVDILLQLIDEGKINIAELYAKKTDSAENSENKPNEKKPVENKADSSEPAKADTKS